MVAVVLSETPKTDIHFKYGIELKEVEIQEPKDDESVIKVQAAALNHRDVWILKGMYHGIVMNSVLGSDMVGIVEKNGTQALPIGTRVLVNPGSGWFSDEKGPENDFHILGLLPCPGTLNNTVTINNDELVACPKHLSTAEAAALPLAGLTAYRALFTKCAVKKGDHVLITGIGGGVALYALQFAVAIGAHVYVSSSSPEKIKRAIELGAKGGINYRDENCMDDLKKILGKNKLAAIVDGAGGPLYSVYPQVLKNGGIIANYGQTASMEGVGFSMAHVGFNIELKGTAMGSRKEFKEMVEFVKEHKIRPIVSKVWHGLDKSSIDEAITTMSNGDQFGKLVIEVSVE